MPENRIELIQGDITLQDVSAIVNAANNSLLGGGGVDGAIHRAAGPELLEECKKLGGCATGEAKVTRGHNLRAEWVIHTVGPIWKDGTHGEDRLLEACYRNCLELARKLMVDSVAFPSISTGAYRFPIERACRIALHEIRQFLEQNARPEKVILVCFDNPTYRHYLNLMG
ncbi:MAG: O-acetyl-ADP-ribose deacetylase [Acidobacteria bacterium]|nr:O-acetyl-ADP-ribose deacetylase [Acidobacteriota bacterium]